MVLWICACLLKRADGEFAVLGMNKKEFVRSIFFIEQLQNMTLSSVQTAVVRFYFLTLIRNLSWLLVT